MNALPTIRKRSMPRHVVRAAAGKLSRFAGGVDVPLPTGESPPGRAGTTMTEVLISLMVMSIGVVSLTSLFPLSLMRSLRAAQLTNATISRYNCEAMLDADQSILAAIPANTKAIIDPIGWNEMNANHAALKDTFGNDGTNVLGTLSRTNGGRTNAADAKFLVGLPDSWTLLHKGAGSALSATSVTIANLSATLAALPANQLKVTLFKDGLARQTSVSRIVTSLSGNTVNWTDPLPGWFNSVSMVRIEQQNLNYTWLVTARKGPASPTTGKTLVSLEVATFYRRAFDIKDETGHSATFQSGSRDVVVTYTGAAPLLKKGSYVFDLENALWYGITELKGQTATSVTVVLDRPAAASSPLAGGHAVFMKGIIQVYHITDKEST